MKKFSQAVVVVPCHSIEDFPTHYPGQEAENLLACWTVVWHPALIAITGQRPQWIRADTTEMETSGSLIVVPSVAKPKIQDSFLQSAQQQNTIIFADRMTREEILDAAFDQNEVAKTAQQKIGPEFAKDFLALGYAYLQIQIMTRQLRYSSNLDESAFAGHLIAAAMSAIEGKDEQAKQSLVACFDLLLEEKNCYYPVQPDLIDLVLTAKTTLGKSLSQQLTSTHPFNLLLTGRDCKTLQESGFSIKSRVRELIDDDSLTIVGGLESELPDPLLSTESVVRQLASGQTRLQQFCGIEPNVFMRRRFGLTPSLPGLLDQFDFSGAIHATLDDGKCPQGSNSNIRWSGSDGESVLAIGTPPLSADDSGALLSLGLTIGNQIDSAHVATVVFAHWPNRFCESFGDLIRASKYGPLLGSFIRLDDYFESVYDPGYGDTFTADEYRNPYLQQAIESWQLNPLSRFTEYWSCHYRLAGCRALLALFWANLAANVSNGNSSETNLPPAIAEMPARFDGLAARLDWAIDAEKTDEFGEILSEMTVAEEQLASMWKRTSPGSGAASNFEDSLNSGEVSRCFFNTTNAKRRVGIATFAGGKLTFRSAGAVVFSDSGEEQTDWVVEIPGMGLAQISTESTSSKDPLRGDPPVSTGNLLRNEFFEIQVDEQTGGIRSIQLYHERTNLISQQLAMRIPGRSTSGQPLTRAHYSTMIVDQIERSSTSRIQGSITSRGRLVDGDQTLAEFKQTLQLNRGIPIADLEIEIDPKVDLTQSINHYFCNRLAWKDESALVVSNDQENKQSVVADWFLATNYLQVQQAEHSLTMLTGGLPYHRRVSRRMIDSLLIVGNERRRKFRLGLAIDIRYPLMTAAQWLTPLTSFDGPASGENAAVQGWLYHFDCRNILATWWQPVFDAAGYLSGVEIRMRETEGRAGKLTLRCPQEIQTAERQNFSGQFMRAIELSSNQSESISFDFNAWEYFQISVHWKKFPNPESANTPS